MSSKFKNCVTLLIRTDRAEEIWIIFICHNGTIAAAVVASHTSSQTKKGLGPKRRSVERVKIFFSTQTESRHCIFCRYGGEGLERSVKRELHMCPKCIVGPRSVQHKS